MIEDETGTSESASLVLVGRSSKANLENSYTDSGIAIDFLPMLKILQLRASGLKFCLLLYSKRRLQSNFYLVE